MFSTYNFKMIVKSIYEVVIHLESFRNIELYYQGLYLIRLQLYDSQKVRTRHYEGKPGGPSLRPLLIIQSLRIRTLENIRCADSETSLHRRPDVQLL